MRPREAGLGEIYSKLRKDWFRFWGIEIAFAAQWFAIILCAAL